MDMTMSMIGQGNGAGPGPLAFTHPPVAIGQMTSTENAVMNPKIDPEFKGLIPVLSNDERALLEENLVKDGCRDPLVVWAGENILLDGHTRLEVCTRRGIEFKVVEIELPDRETAEAWIIRNQLGRRNLPPFVRAELALKLEPLIAKKAKQNEQRGGNASGMGRQKSDNPLDTKKEVAKIAGVSHDTIAKAKVIKQKAADPVKDALRRGETSINKVYEDIRQKEEPEAAKAVLEEDKPRAAKTKFEAAVVVKDSELTGDSHNLQQLKHYWQRAGKDGKKAFLEWTKGRLKSKAIIRGSWKNTRDLSSALREMQEAADFIIDLHPEKTTTSTITSMARAIIKTLERFIVNVEKQ